MAGPITWQTVAGNSLENAWRPMQGAVTTFDSGLDRLSKMITDRQDVNQGVADRAREANVQAYLDKVQSANTPEAMAALHASGELDPLRAAIDPRDAARVRGADEVRLTAVQQLQAAARKAGEDTFLFQNQGTIAQAQALAAQGKKKEAMDLAAPLMAHPIYGDIVAKAVAGDQQVQLFKNTLDDSVAKRQAEKINADANATSAAAATSNASTNAGNLQISRLDHAVQEQQRINEQLTKLGANTIGGQGSFDTMAADIKSASEDKGQTAKLTSLVSDALNSDPRYANLPTSKVKEIALKQLRNVGTGFLNMLDPRTDMNSTVLAALKADFNKALGDTGTHMDDIQARRAQLQEQLKVFTPTLDEARRGVFPQTQAQIDAAAARAPAGGGAVVPAGAAPGSSTGDQARVAAARAAILGGGNMPEDGSSPAAAAPVAPVAAPAQPAANTKLVQLAQTELALHNRGELKTLSPEVQKFVDQQSARDRQALVASLKDAGTGTAKLGAAAADLFTLPVRAGMGVANNAIRGINALGVNAPYIPDTNGMISSITPYSDMLARRAGQTGSLSDLKALREQLQKELRSSK